MVVAQANQLEHQPHHIKRTLSVSVKVSVPLIIIIAQEDSDLQIIVESELLVF